MGRYGLRQFCVLVLACGVYFGGLSRIYLHSRRDVGADDLMAFAFESFLAWILLGAVYVYWRQWTPLAVHCLCVVLSLPIVLNNPDVIVPAGHFGLATIGPCCRAGTLISFPISLVLLALSTVLGRRIDPLVSHFERGQVVSRPNP